MVGQIIFNIILIVSLSFACVREKKERTENTSPPDISSEQPIAKYEKPDYSHYSLDGFWLETKREILVEGHQDKSQQIDEKSAHILFFFQNRFATFYLSNGTTPCLGDRTYSLESNTIIVDPAKGCPANHFPLFSLSRDKLVAEGNLGDQIVRLTFTLTRSERVAQILAKVNPVQLPVLFTSELRLGESISAAKPEDIKPIKKTSNLSSLGAVAPIAEPEPVPPPPPIKKVPEKKEITPPPPAADEVVNSVASYAPIKEEDDRDDLPLGLDLDQLVENPEVLECASGGMDTYKTMSATHLLDEFDGSEVCPLPAHTILCVDSEFDFATAGPNTLIQGELLAEIEDCRMPYGAVLNKHLEKVN